MPASAISISACGNASPRRAPCRLAIMSHLARERLRLIAALDEEMQTVDALILPTTPNVAPTIAEANASDEAFFMHNGRALRNTAFANFFDICAISLPMPTGGLPAGLQLVGRGGEDRKLFAIARALEATLHG